MICFLFLLIVGGVVIFGLFYFMVYFIFGGVDCVIE